MHVLTNLLLVSANAGVCALLQQPLGSKPKSSCTWPTSCDCVLPFEISNCPVPSATGAEMLDLESRRPLTFSPTWQLLGPFQIGTREAAWGADPLAYYGGFHTLEPDPKARFASSLAFNGTTGWSERALEAEADDSNPHMTEIPLRVTFPEIDFASLRSVYGWAATQFQCWARADFTLAGETRRTVLLWTDQILELRVDGREYFGGDFFALRNAPTVLWLEPGEHRIEVRIVRDVRSMGGVGEPEASVRLKWDVLPERGDFPPVAVESGVMPDLVKGQRFAGEHRASIKVRNDDIETWWVDHVRTASPSVKIAQGLDLGISLAPGQTREVSLMITASECNFDENQIEFQVSLSSISGKSGTVTFSQPMTGRKLFDAHKFTFLHPSKAVSYAILEPPMLSVSDMDNTTEVPVLINLHGAGLEVDSDEVRNLFRDLKPFSFWLLHPSGMTSWSGDDWHPWGYADAEAALAAIRNWIVSTGWQGPGAILDKYYVVGHSNGGQGAWYALTHRPDRVVAAAAVSGYSHIEAYVPYQLWSGTDPAIASILSSARLPYRHDLLADNFAGIPVTQQHGSADDNVPPFHSRFMYQASAQSGKLNDFLEIANKSHWYDGVMETDLLKSFYKNISTSGLYLDLPLRFTLVATPNGEVGARGGLKIAQLYSPYQLGTIEVSRSLEDQVPTWSLETKNVLSFVLERSDMPDPDAVLVVDGQRLDITPMGARRQDKGHEKPPSLENYLQSPEGNWEMGPEAPQGRSSIQLGGFDALLRTPDTIDVIYGDRGDLLAAGQISKNLYQYFRADTNIAPKGSLDLEERSGNRVYIHHGHVDDPFWTNSAAKEKTWPIQFTPEGLKLTLMDGRVRRYPYRPGLGLYYLRPIDADRVEVMIWGWDVDGLQRVVRLLPTTTGIGQPDFVVLGPEAAWKGAGGALAMGFFDCHWNISAGSYVP